MWSHTGSPIPQVTITGSPILQVTVRRSNEQQRVASIAKHSLPVTLQVPGRHRFARISMFACARGERFAWVRGVWVRGTACVGLESGGPTVVSIQPDHGPACLADSDVRCTRNGSTGGGASLAVGPRRSLAIDPEGSLAIPAATRQGRDSMVANIRAIWFKL
jgi:hypothetical protein